MMSEGRRNERDLSRPDLEYAHRFAIERLSNENRTFWTRLSALLLGNSFLVAGFASLYASKNPNETLLLAIAAGGILIQAMWPLFALLSYSTNQYLVGLTKDIEEYPYLTRNQFLKKGDIEKRVRRIWTHYAEHFWKTFSRKPRISRALIEAIKKYPAGSIASFIFFIAFLGIWICALIITV